MSRSHLLPFIDDPGNPIGCLASIFMRPDPENHPAKSLQAVIRIRIPSSIGFDFVPPEAGIAFRPGGVFRTAVPETTVDEDCEAGPREDDICDAPGLGQQGYMQAIAKASGV
jgi:hypothetical protein